jgi:hypothetical protein
LLERLPREFDDAAVRVPLPLALSRDLNPDGAVAGDLLGAELYGYAEGAEVELGVVLASHAGSLARTWSP